MAEADPQKTFNVHEAKTNLSRLMDRAHDGEEIVLAKAGEPWAKIVPYVAPVKYKRQPGGWAELASVPASIWLEPLPDEELDRIDDRPRAERR